MTDSKFTSRFAKIRMTSLLSKFEGYVPALVSLAIAIALHYAFMRMIGPRFPGLLFMYLVVLLIGGWCGYGPGVLISVLLVTLVPYLFTPGFQFAKVNFTSLTVLILLSLIVSGVSANRRRAEKLLLRMNQELESRVRQQTAELQRSNEALRRANDDLAQFAYIAAHDLQEPLRTVVIFSEMVRRDCGGTLPAKSEEHLQRIVSAGKRLSRLITDLLEYSRLAADDAGPAQSVDLNRVLTSVLEGLGHRIAESNANIVHDSLPVVAGDPGRLEQVFQNLIGNALKYRKEGVRPEIQVRASPQNGSWVFAIQDNGQGFEQTYADRIFGIFKRLHGHTVSGSGIGLAICKTVVEHHGGKVWAESDLGKGATFFFTLPALNGERKV